MAESLRTLLVEEVVEIILGIEAVVHLSLAVHSSLAINLSPEAHSSRAAHQTEDEDGDLFPETFVLVCM